ncbi:MAG: acetyl-CoA acetyltransferase [Acidimicrobiaceae bacterium]|nr:acetyl-CoA acetyltransferase [Acidimicrobiaceae bacterium]
MTGSYLLAGARTPIGKLAGSLAGIAATELGGVAIAAALARAGVAPDDVDAVVMGHVLQAGQGQCTARQAAVAAGLPMSVHATSLNKVCLSGLSAIHLADLMIRAGEAEVVVAGGMESMTRAPYVVDGARQGIRFGDAALRDTILADGLTCAFDEMLMGEATDRYAAAFGISRDEQDEWAVRSHARAVAARDAGRLAEEIVEVESPGRRGESHKVIEDEGVRPDTSAAGLAALKPAFSVGGSITAGNASQISDGAAAIVVVAPSVAERLGVAPLAEIVGYGQVAGPDTSLLTQPARAILDALRRGGLRIDDLDLLELNEAFAAVVVASTRELGLPGDIVNVNGGAIALGHPIGMSGARVALTLAQELRRGSGELGAAALCGGGGQGDAILLKPVS